MLVSYLFISLILIIVLSAKLKIHPFFVLAALGFQNETEKAMAVCNGAGSMVVSYANDSFFWVAAQLSRIDIKNGYRLYITGTFVLGISAITSLFIFYLIFA